MKQLFCEDVRDDGVKCGTEVHKERSHEGVVVFQVTQAVRVSVVMASSVDLFDLQTGESQRWLGGGI